MEKVKISSGKLRGIRMLADEEGKFRMMAIDQRGSLQRILGKVMDKDPKQVSPNDLSTFKKSVIKVLSPYSSATLTDPVYGYPYAAEYLPKNVGLLLATEQTGAELGGRSGKERKSRLQPGWNISKTKRAGANAVKLLMYYRGDASSDVVQHQKDIILKVGEECEKYDLPYVLEIVSYPFKQDEDKDNVTFAKRKPEIVMDYTREFSKPEYKVNILKIEFPANLKYCKEFSGGEFDGKKREPAYNLSEVEDYCKELTSISSVPWVILSAGVNIKEFLVNVKLATENGASGFLGGRAIWQDAAKYYPDVEKVEGWLSTSGVDNFRRLYEASKNATPYFNHKSFGSFANIELDLRGENWHIDYKGL
ncbi:tagatose 1,6-diphosphate aldolase [Candidatus Aerophobetes bacterium]|nr:tagatose 1,6-diphosphate aldolase [Candidatus Aerophobetes bacterium]